MLVRTKLSFLASRHSTYFFFFSTKPSSPQILCSSPKHALLDKLHSPASGPLLALCLVSSGYLHTNPLVLCESTPIAGSIVLVKRGESTFDHVGLSDSQLA